MPTLLKRFKQFTEKKIMNLRSSSEKQTKEELKAKSPLEKLQLPIQLGSGGFGEIYLGYTKDIRKPYAVKTISKKHSLNEFLDTEGETHTCKAVIEKEIQAGKLLHHKNISKFICSYEDEDTAYLVFEYIQGSDMFSFLEAREFEPFSEEDAKGIFLQLLDAVSCCHSNGVVHFDIKIENIMYNPVTHLVTLIDFGLCEFITKENNGIFSKCAGSVDYCAPELMKPSPKFFGTNADIFSLGVVLFVLVTGCLPFDVNKRMYAVLHGLRHPFIEFVGEMSEDCKSLIRSMLEPNPAYRIDLKGVYQHSWIKDKQQQHRNVFSRLFRTKN